MKEIIAPIRIEKIIENPMDTPSIFTKNKSNVIIFGLRLMNIKKNVIRKIKKMKYKYFMYLF